ncbi:MAG: PQQ-dependent sugar dehydrogenase [Anaerolineae bacterium]|nr:PQQ-dependent sugar dehydrogenase [Anaerolineae bacterium]
MLILAMLTLSTITGGQAQTLPPCEQRHTTQPIPRVDSTRYCLEQVIDDPTTDEISFTALTTAPNGDLYAARPLADEVWRITDSDGDQLPDQGEVVIPAIHQPTALSYHEGALYIVSESVVYRWRENEGLTVLVDDLPASTRHWITGFTIGPDDRLYLGIAAPCAYCPDDPLQGVILSFELEGDDQQIIARGFHVPSALTWETDRLWAADIAPKSHHEGRLDELNQVTPNAHFGYPDCLGESDSAVCLSYTAPMLTLPSHSTVLSMVYYNGMAFEHLQDTLLLALAGSSHQSNFAGYSLVAVTFRENRQPRRALQSLIPSVTTEEDMQNLQHRGEGLYPQRPYGIALSPEGWIYLSVSGGTIYALRPA